VSRGFSFVSGERRPVEVLVFGMDPARVDEFLRVDHEVWTLGEALLDGLDRIPFLAKEVWLDDSRPGEVTLVFVWESMEQWDAVGRPDIQRRLQAEFDARLRLARGARRTAAHRPASARLPARVRVLAAHGH
jgi:uncharacterized protein (TIGR03792 family)